MIDELLQRNLPNIIEKFHIKDEANWNIARNKIKNIALMIFIVEIIISFLNNIIGDASFYSVMLISTFYIIDLIVRKYNSRKLKIRNKVSLY